MTGYTYSFPVDGNGWSSFTASGTAHDGYSAATPVGTTNIIHVASNGNDATGDGSAATPFLTVAHGRSLLRNGSPDWLLLRKGDTFTNDTLNAAGTQINGKSATEPMLIGAYGTGARPILKYNSSTAAFEIGSADNGQYVAIAGVEFYCYDRDPNNVGYAGTTITGAANNGSGLIRLTVADATKFSTGQAVTVSNVVGTTEANSPGTSWTITVIDTTHIDLQGSTFTNAYVSGGNVLRNLQPIAIDWSHGTAWNLIEDCRIHYFATGIRLQTDTSTNLTNTKNNVFIRRNIIDYNYNGLGIFCKGIGYGYDGSANNSVVLYQNFFDHNTWNDTWFGKGKTGTLLSHSVYLDPDAGGHGNDAATQNTYTNGPLILDGNIIARDSVGSHFKGGAICSNNLWARNGTAFDFARPLSGISYSITGDVFAEFEAMSDNSGLNSVGVGLIVENDYMTCTMTKANPCVVTTQFPHPYTAGAPIQFVSGGTDVFPSPISTSTVYYVISVPTSTTFTFSATKGGAGVNTTGGSDSGTHHIYWGSSYGTATIQNCLFANYAGNMSDTSLNGYAFACDAMTWQSAQFVNNIVYKWGFGGGLTAPSNTPIRDGSTYTPDPVVISPNDVYLGGTPYDTVASSVYSYLDNRTLALYAQNIGVGSTHNDLLDYIGTNQSKDTWDSRLTAAAIITYFRDTGHHGGKGLRNF